MIPASPDISVLREFFLLCEALDTELGPDTMAEGAVEEAAENEDCPGSDIWLL